jgi:hypothetical protein
MKEKLIALDTAGAEAEWLRELLIDLLVVENYFYELRQPNCDN